MKRNFLKNMVPIAVAVLGTAGAFVTTSMQKVGSATPTLGYVLDENDICDVPVQCDADPNPICKHSDGQTAYGLDNQGNCNVTLFMPSN